MDLALFDFDGTVTSTGTYPGFVVFSVGRARKIVGAVVLAPIILGYKMRLVSDRRIRSTISRVAFWNDSRDRLRESGRRYATEILPAVLRPEVMDRIAWHKDRGDRVVVVSASLDFYLEPWCQAQGLDVICSRLEVRDGRLTGRYHPADCCYEEKSRRILEQYSLKDYETVHAYGDSEEDRPMLDLAHRRYFRGREVTGTPRISS